MVLGYHFEESSDDFDPFAEDPEQDARDEAILAEVERKAAEQLKKREEENKAKGKVVVDRSRVSFDVKVVDETVNLEALYEKISKECTMEGLVYQGYSIKPVYGPINMLRIVMDIEDDKVSTDELFDMIQEKYEDEVQSIDIYNFNKL